MCGIIGYVGKASAAPILVEGLRRLEYRGYDSSGIAVSNGSSSIETRKKSGRLVNLKTLLSTEPAVGNCGISHTRWATHGEPSDANAHPHLDQSGRLALVHNGVIENYQIIKGRLLKQGHVFQSQTDTEVLAHLMGRSYDASTETDPQKRLVKAVRESLKQVTGTYGVAVMHADVPGFLVGARLGSPLVVGLGKGENFLASDVSAIVSHTTNAIYLQDRDLVYITEDDFTVENFDGDESAYEVSQVEFTAEAAEKGDYPHYMLKEIFEQPTSIQNAFRGRLIDDQASAILGGLGLTPRELRDIERIVLCGCGTASHAAMVGEYMIEHLARIPTEVEIASEFRYRNPPLDKNTLAFVISQSGETIDTLAAMREGQRKGHRVLGIVNSVASTIARESDGGSYLHSGPEIGVAATKSFTSQVTVLALLALLLGRMRHLSVDYGQRLLKEIRELPAKVEKILEQTDYIREIALKYIDAPGMLFLGRQFNYPTALEGALKMKEISYIFASGHAAAELKHGVIALVSESVPSVFIMPRDSVYDKNVSTLEEVKARKGPVIAITTEGSTDLERIADDVIYIPEVTECLSPILAVIPLQLLSYHFAVARGCDVDKPRNLAKSVTVE
ncbi:MAG: glutamine--fructose-6-phosphate transaminase (isomerizing) [Verrucomicrobiales bacterium]|jgi:glutamine---fructose-6-phosphate transaminase (isomerizing)|nr:glutamine--fructose-6-phosphate transaminase (isomerizing) [Verrucomicrobiales bacterium]MDP4791893.1 glutamine--fructose-6-phosphate transaminase (isomerizing) [Verrucomicrobiales bacterium]MDP5005138.1 glutamine--fructose-6-phosphate transaminase (isomerizing) [Verrucomicrobiales bacterium]